MWQIKIFAPICEYFVNTGDGMSIYQKKSF